MLLMLNVAGSGFRRSLLFIIFYFLFSPARAQLGAQTLRQQMDSVAQANRVSFVYDSRLVLDLPPAETPLQGLGLEEALRRLFARTNIMYKVQGDHVLLKQAADGAGRGQTWTVIGHVRDALGELLINATVYDLTSHQGTITNQYGY